jgi:large subunit ribosomal protein L4e
MFAPTKVYRRWHRKVNLNQKRYAVVSALAASSSTALVLARGHRIERIPEVPLVVADRTITEVTKTSAAVKILQALNAYTDVEKVKRSRKLRAGKGKLRNRRYTQKRGPLIIYDQKAPLNRAFRNLPGVEQISVHALNLLLLAPGGHLGRFIIWTRSAFERLDRIFGTLRKPSALKKGFVLPRPVITNSDLGRLINSQEIQSHLRAKKRQNKYSTLKKNPLKNLGVMLKLNPYAKTLRRRELTRQSLRSKAKAARFAAKKAGKESTVKPAKIVRTKKEGKAGKNFRRKVTMNPHKKALVKSLYTNQ